MAFALDEEMTNITNIKVIGVVAAVEMRKPHGRKWSARN